MVYEKIWQKVLNPHEEVKYEFTVSKRYRYWIAVSAGILFGLLSIILPPLGIPLLILTLFHSLFYMQRANIYAFTTDRIVIHQGWLSTKMTTVDYNKITDIHVNEPLLERVLYKTGNLAINTAGSSKLEIVLKNIERPFEVKKKLDEFRKHLTSTN